MVLRFILDIPTFLRCIWGINIFALYPRYLDINRPMWMQNLMKSKDEISINILANNSVPNAKAWIWITEFLRKNLWEYAQRQKFNQDTILNLKNRWICTEAGSDNVSWHNIWFREKPNIKTTIENWPCKRNFAGSFLRFEPCRHAKMGIFKGFMHSSKK